VIGNRVLLADPDGELLQCYRAFLMRDGFDVLTAADALECVARLRSFVPDALVLDPVLPWGQGEGVLAMMYEDPRVPLLPVMVLTAAEDLPGPYGVGIFPVSAYYLKPMTAGVLARSLRRLLARHAWLRGERTFPAGQTRLLDVIGRDQEEIFSNCPVTPQASIW
jgi:DNA-binding response OmpR family regulator